MVSMGRDGENGTGILFVFGLTKARVNAILFL